MAEEKMQVSFSETTVALANTTLTGFIDDFYASIDVTYTPVSMKIVASMILVIRNAGGDEEIFKLSFEWFEDAATINTRMKNILQAFTAGITAMEAASSYTTIQTLSGKVVMTIIYT